MEENLSFDPSVVDELWVRAVAQEMLRFAKSTGEETLARGVDSEAVRILTEIKGVLDDPELDDPECFLDVFYRAGLTTRRHIECG